MVRDDGGELVREVGRVAARFATWRRTRVSRRERIPPELWQAAVEASARTGIRRTARILRLNEQELRRRARDGEAEAAVLGVTQGAAGFVELRPAAAPPAARSWVVELESAAGARLRIEGRGAGEIDVASLAAALLRASS